MRLNIWRPDEPARFLADDALRALPHLLARAGRLEARRRDRPELWSNADRMELDELRLDIATARRFFRHRFTWAELDADTDVDGLNATG